MATAEPLLVTPTPVLLAHPHAARWVYWATILGLVLGTLAGTLNNNIVTIAFPALMEAHQVPVDQVVWVSVCFIVGLAAFIPVGGRLGDLFGYRRVYLGGLVVLLVGCVLASAPVPFWLLLVLRLVQGVGAATVTPAVMAIMARDFPSERRGQLLGLWALAGSVGTALGPVLGGVLTTRFGWGAIFGAAIPVLLVAILLGLRFLPADRPGRVSFHDRLGAGLLIATVLSATLAIQQASRPATHGVALVAAAVTAGSLVLFIGRERSVARPFLPLSLFRVPGYVAATLIVHLQMLLLGASLTLAPLYLISLRGLSTELAGLLVFPLPLALVASVICGRVSDRLGARPLALAGTVLMAVQFALATQWDHFTPLWLVVTQLALAGLGMALIQAPLAALVTKLVPASTIGVSSGVFNMMRFLGNMLGVTLAGVLVHLLGDSSSSLSGSSPTSLAPAFLVVAALAASGTVLSLLIPALSAVARPATAPAADRSPNQS